MIGRADILKKQALSSDRLFERRSWESPLDSSRYVVGKLVHHLRKTTCPSSSHGVPPYELPGATRLDSGGAAMKRVRRMSNTSLRCAAARSPLIAHTGWRTSPSARRAGPAGLPACRTAAAATAMHARSEQSFRTIHLEEKNAPAIALAAKRTETPALSFKARRAALHRPLSPKAARRRGTYAASKDLSPARGGNLNPPKPRLLLSWCRQVDIASPRVNACDDTCGGDDCPHAQCAPPFHGSAAPASVGRYGSVFRYHERHMSFVQARRRRRRESPLPFVCEQVPGSQSNHAARGRS